MMKRIFNTSKRRLDVDGDDGEDYDDLVEGSNSGGENLDRRGRPTTATASQQQQQDESESENLDAGFFERLGEGLDPNWDEWSVGKDGSSSRRMDLHTTEIATKSESAPSRSEDLTASSKSRGRKKKSFVALSAKLRKLEETGFSGVPSGSASLAAMTTGGMFVGKSTDPKSRLDALVLERSNSDSNLNGKKKKKKDKSKRRDGTSSSPTKSKSSASALSKKIRKSSRRGTDSDIMSQTSHARTHRSRSTNRRAKMKRNKSLSQIASLQSTFSDNEEDDKSKKKKRKEKEKRSSEVKDDASKGSEGVRSKDGSKKKDKKKRSKSIFADDASGSVASKTSTLASFEGSEPLSPLGLSPKEKSRKKKEKDKDKEKDKTKPRRAKSTTDALLHPPLNDIETKPTVRKRQSMQSRKRGSSVNRKPSKERRKRGTSTDAKPRRRYSGSGLGSVPQRGLLRRHSSADLKEFAKKANLGPSDDGVDVLLGDKFVSTSTANVFESAWSTDQKAAAEKEAKEAAAKAAEVQNTLNAAIAGSQSIGDSSDGDQREKILSLQNQLAEALDKMVAISREQIQDKDQFLKASSELAQTKAELKQATEARTELLQEVKDRDAAIEEERERIEKLEQAIERQLDTQDALEVKLEKSEDEVEKLLIEMQELEASNGVSENGEGGGASFAELHQTRKALAEKEEELKSQGERIAKLEQDLKDSLTVPQMQIEELDGENKALQGKLKAERLDYMKQLEIKDKSISDLQLQVDSYSGTSDAPDLVSARQKLNEAREDATAVREDLEAAKKVIEQLQEEREDLVKRNDYLKSTTTSLEKNVQELTERSDQLTEKVKQWTERTYEWKSKAENAERKLDAMEDSDGGSEASGEVVSEAPQGLFLQAAMEKNTDKKKGNKWNIFQQKDLEDEDATVDNIRIRTLEERNQTLEDVVTELRSEIVKIQAAHKDEDYRTQKRIAQLEGENEALSLQNETLEQLSRANH